MELHRPVGESADRAGAFARRQLGDGRLHRSVAARALARACARAHRRSSATGPTTRRACSSTPPRRSAACCTSSPPASCRSPRPSCSPVSPSTRSARRMRLEAATAASELAEAPGAANRRSSRRSRSSRCVARAASTKRADAPSDAESAAAEARLPRRASAARRRRSRAAAASPAHHRRAAVAAGRRHRSRRVESGADESRRSTPPPTRPTRRRGDAEPSPRLVEVQRPPHRPSAASAPLHARRAELKPFAPRRPSAAQRRAARARRPSARSTTTSTRSTRSTSSCSRSSRKRRRNCCPSSRRTCATGLREPGDAGARRGVHAHAAHAQGQRAPGRRDAPGRDGAPPRDADRAPDRRRHAASAADVEALQAVSDAMTHAFDALRSRDAQAYSDAVAAATAPSAGGAPEPRPRAAAAPTRRCRRHAGRAGRRRVDTAPATRGPPRHETRRRATAPARAADARSRWSASRPPPLPAAAPAAIDWSRFSAQRSGGRVKPRRARPAATAIGGARARAAARPPGQPGRRGQHHALAPRDRTSARSRARCAT